MIAPWNYPWSIPFGEVAIALMAGNGVVLKPASLTPADRPADPGGLRARRASRGPGRDRARRRRGRRRRWSSRRAGKIFFTGSVEVGRGVGEECARRMKGSVLELGGKDPQIVCADANLANAISGAVWGGFANAGQTCSGIERTYVVREVADRFIDGVVREAERLTVGDPLEWDDRDRPDGLQGAVRPGLRARRRRDRVGREAAVRRPASRCPASPGTSSLRPC